MPEINIRLVHDPIVGNWCAMAKVDGEMFTEYGGWPTEAVRNCLEAYYNTVVLRVA